MIVKTINEVFSKEWGRANITNRIHPLVILRLIIPWEVIVTRLSRYYHDSQGPVGKPLRMMVALLIVAKWYGWSDRGIVEQVKENRYVQYFCNVPDKGLQTFLHPTSLVKFRQRLGEAGMGVIEEEVFQRFRRAGVIEGEMALIDSSVLPNDIIHPNDVHLIVKAFKKMKQCAKLHNIEVWWDEGDVKRLWREFSLTKGADRLQWLKALYWLWWPAWVEFRRTLPKPPPKRYGGQLCENYRARAWSVPMLY